MEIQEDAEQHQVGPEPQTVSYAFDPLRAFNGPIICFCNPGLRLLGPQMVNLNTFPFF